MSLTLFNQTFTVKGKLGEKTKKVKLECQSPGFCDFCNRDHDDGHLIANANGSGRLTVRCHRSPEKFAFVNIAINDGKFEEAIRTEDRFINYEMSHRMLFIKSPMGSGKTKCLIDKMKSCKYDRVIVISFRKTFTSEIAEKLKPAGFESYMEIDGKIDMPRIVIQFESLHRLALFEYGEAERPHTDDMENMLVVIDEAKSIVSQIVFSGKTRSPKNNVKIMATLIERAKNVLIMDAFIDIETVNLYKSIIVDLDDNHTMAYVNRYPVWRDKKILHMSNEVDWLYTLMCKLKAGHRCSAAIGFKKNIRTVVNVVKVIFGEDFPYVVYTGDTAESVKRADFANVNESWEDKRLILHTSTLLAGVSYERPIDYVFGWFRQCDDIIIKAEDIIQMLGRYRISTQIYLCLPTMRKYKKLDEDAATIGTDFSTFKARPFEDRIKMLECSMRSKSKFDYIGRAQCFINEMGGLIISKSIYTPDDELEEMKLDDMYPLREERMERLASVENPWPLADIEIIALHLNVHDLESKTLIARAKICDHYNISVAAELDVDWFKTYMPLSEQNVYTRLCNYYSPDVSCPQCTTLDHPDSVCIIHNAHEISTLIGFEQGFYTADSRPKSMVFTKIAENAARLKVIMHYSKAVNEQGLYEDAKKYIYHTMGYKLEMMKDGLRLLAPIDKYSFINWEDFGKISTKYKPIIPMSFSYAC